MHSDDYAADAADAHPDAQPESTGSAGAASNDNDSEPSPRKRRPRRRKRAARRPSTEKASTEKASTDDAATGEEAGAFLDPPPIEGGDEARSRKKRKRKRARRRPKSAEAEASEAPETSEAAGEDDARPRKARKSRKRTRARKPRKVDITEEPDVEAPDPDAPAEERAPRKKRAKRKSAKKRSKSRGRKDKRDDGDDRKRGRSRRDDRRGRFGRDRHRDPRAIDIVPQPETPAEAGVEKVLLVNAEDRDEARIALLVDGVLEEVYIEASKDRSAAGNIHRGRIQNVEQGIGAAFVDLGRGLTGFLHASDMPVPADEEAGADIMDRLTPGDEVIVQITRDGIGRKGPALTGRISLPGRYLVLMPFTNRSGISRRIPQGSERERMRKLLRKLEVPEGMGVIVRTASETTDLAALTADLNQLFSEWERIKLRANQPDSPGVLRGESDLAERSVRDIMPADATRIVVDKEETAGRIHQLLRTWYPSAAAAAEAAGHLAVRAAAAASQTPIGELEAARDDDEEFATGLVDDDFVEPLGRDDDDRAGEDRAADDRAGDDRTGDDRAGDDEAADDEDGGKDKSEDADAEVVETELERQERIARAIPEVLIHTDPMPLFHAYDAETQLEDAFRRSIRLPAGGSIVIDPTEALVAIDVNSGRLTDEADPESTALVTNLEAVTEIARQLRLRDRGGLIVIDFIDMRERKSRNQVEKTLREALSKDRARIRLGRMGPFGCVILSRQRIRQALTRITHDECGDCHGTGRRRNMVGMGLRVLREMEARVARSRGRGGLEVRAPQAVVEWVRKQRPAVLKRIRKACSGPVTLEADGRLASDGWAMKGVPPTSKGEEGGE